LTVLLSARFSLFYFFIKKTLALVAMRFKAIKREKEKNSKCTKDK